MTRETALSTLTITWLVGSFAVATFMVVQLILGKYGSDYSAPLTWLSAQVAPVIGLLLSGYFSSPTNTWKQEQVTGHRFTVALMVSLVQFAAIIIPIVLEPLVTATPFEIFDRTILLSSIWQGVVTACVGGIVFDGR